MNAERAREWAARQGEKRPPRGLEGKEVKRTPAKRERHEHGNDNQVSERERERERERGTCWRERLWRVGSASKAKAKDTFPRAEAEEEVSEKYMAGLSAAMPLLKRGAKGDARRAGRRLLLRGDAQVGARLAPHSR